MSDQAGYFSATSVKHASQKCDRLRAKLNAKEVLDDASNAVRARAALVAKEVEATSKKGSPNGLAAPTSSVLRSFASKEGNQAVSAQSRMTDLEAKLAMLELSTAAGPVVLTEKAGAKAKVVEGPSGAARRTSLAKGTILPPNASLQRRSSQRSVSMDASASDILRAGSVVQRRASRASLSQVDTSTASLTKGAQSPGSLYHGDDESVGDYRDSSQFSPARLKPRPEITYAVSPSLAPMAPSEWLQKASEHAEYPNAEDDLREHNRKRDEHLRAKSPVERYSAPWLHKNQQARLWEERGLRVDVDSVRVRSPLSVLSRDKGIPSTHSETRLMPPGSATSSTDPFTLMASNHQQLLQFGKASRELRGRFKHLTDEELKHGGKMMNPSVTETVPQALSLPATCDSSDEENDDTELSRICFGDADRQPPPGKRAANMPRQHADASDICDLVECCVVCLCQHALAKKGAVGPTRDIAVLRNILIHALTSSLNHVETERRRRERELQALERQRKLNALGDTAAANQATTSDSVLNPADIAIVARLMRTFAKGVESLLVLEIETHGAAPFSPGNDIHLTQLAKHYCTLHRMLQERSTRLMTRWKEAKVVADSAIANNDVASLLPVTPNMVKAQNIIDYCAGVAAITEDDLSQLDASASDVAYKQRQLAQMFLGRFQKYMPTQTVEAEKITPADLEQRPASLQLRHVLLNYAGLLCPESSKQTSTSSANQTKQQHPVDFLSNRIEPKGVQRFLNVFKSTWGRTNLSADVPTDEANDRATVLQNGNLVAIIDAYLHLLSGGMQDRFRHLVASEKSAHRKADEKMRSDVASVYNQLHGGKATQQDPREREKEQALEYVERQQLLSKYARSNQSQDVLEQLAKTVRSTDEWFEYECSRRAARLDAANGDISHSIHSNGAGAQDENVLKDESASLQPSGQGGQQQPSQGGASRMERQRNLKLQELVACWTTLQIPYSHRLPLHDKWNAKDMRNIDHGIKLYKACIEAVQEREKAVEAVVENERSDKPQATKVERRNALFTAMCAAGQKCELAAKKLTADVGEDLLYKGAPYSYKLKADFAMISTLLRQQVPQ